MPDLNPKGCLQLFDTSLQVEVAPPPAKRLPSVVPGPPPVHALARFDDDGAEYLNFVAGDLIMIRAPPPGVDAAGWAYGFLPRTGRCLFFVPAGLGAFGIGPSGPGRKK